MPGILKKLASQTIVYGLSSILGRFVNYLLVPFYTSIFIPEEYGIITEIYAYLAFLNVVYVFGMETTFFRFSSLESKEDHFNKIQSFLLIFTSVLSLVLLLFSPNLNQILGYQIKPMIIPIAILILWSDSLVAIPFAKLRKLEKPMRFAMIKLANIYINVIFNLFFLLALPILVEIKGLGFLKAIYNPNFNIEYVFLSNLFSNLITFFLTLPFWKNFTITINKESFQKYLKYAAPLMVMGLAGMVNEVIDRILLKELLPNNFYNGKSSLWAVGVYGSCYKLSIFMSLAIQAFRFAAEPFFFAKAKDKNAPDLYAKIMLGFVAVCTIIFLAVSLNLDYLQYLLIKTDFRKGIHVVPILLVANLFLGIYYNLSIWYKLSNKTYMGMYISIGGMLITLIANWILIPKLGIHGAAWATLICYCSMAFTSYLLGQRYYFVPYKIVKIMFLILLSVAIFYFSQKYFNQFIFIRFLILTLYTIFCVFFIEIIFSRKNNI